MRNLALLCFLMTASPVAIGDAPDWTEGWQVFGQWAAMPVEGGSRALAQTSEDKILLSLDFYAEGRNCGTPALVLHFSDGRVSDIGRSTEFDVLIEYRVDRNEIWHVEQPTLLTQQSLDGRRAVDMLLTNIDLEFVSEIREGQFLRVKAADARAFRVDLSGSMAAIDTAHGMCTQILQRRPSNDDEYFRPSDDEYFQNPDDVFF